MKPKIRKTKSDRIMIEHGISLDAFHKTTNLANPTLLHVTKGRKIAITEFIKRTLVDIGEFFEVPFEDFLGWEGGKLSQKEFIAPKGKFRVVGIDLLDASKDWIEDFEKEKRAIKFADKNKTETLKTYVYDDKGKRMDEIGEDDEVENEEEVVKEKES